MVKVLTDALRRFSGLTTAAVFGAGVVGVLGVGALDYVTGYEIGFSLFYLAPVSLVAWTKGRGAGYVTATLAAFIWLGADSLAGHRYSHVAIAYWNMAIRLGFFVFFVAALAALADAVARDRESARTDYLTALNNSRAFYDLAAAELERARRYGHPLAVAYVDVDNFKELNDEAGHREGDECLRVTGDVIKRAVRAGDIPARMGGDEFVVLMPETAPAEAVGVAERLRAALGASTRGRGWPVSFSIGVASFATAPPTAGELVKRADELMYKAKAAGKNRVVAAAAGY